METPLNCFFSALSAVSPFSPPWSLEIADLFSVIKDSVQFTQTLSPVWVFVTPWTAAQHASLSFTKSQACSNSCHWVGDVIQPPHPLFSLLLLPSLFLSIRVFSNESVLHLKWPKYWSFSFSVSPSNEYSGLISFRMDWLDLLAVQGTFKNFHIVQKHQFFSAQLSL